MSVTVQEITKSVTATIVNEYTKALLETANGALAGNEAAKGQLLPLIQSWIETTTQRVGAGLGNLAVSITGVSTGAPSGQFPPQQGFGAVAGAQFPPQQQGFGQFPPPQQQQAQQQPFGGGPAGGVPPQTSATLQGCGSTRVPLTHSNQGCTCGIEHRVQNYTGHFFCARPADTQNMKTQTWSCSKHKSRDTLDLKGGKKSGGTGAGSVVSAQQVNGLRQPIGFPVGFASNPGFAGGLANAMAQQPAAPGFNFAGPGAFAPPPQPAGVVNISNPQLSSQLMSAVTQQLNNIPQQQSPFPGGAGLNMAAMLQAPPANGVNVGSGFTFPGLGGASPFTNPGAAAPQQIHPQQIHPQQTAAPPSGGSDDDDGESSDEDQPDPIERAPEASIAAALANAIAFGGPSQHTVVASPAGGLQMPANPMLNAAIANAQPAQQLGGFQFPAPAQTAAPNPMAAFVNQALNNATH